MSPNNEIDPIESPLDPDTVEGQVPLSGTVDDDDNMDDERWDENEAPSRPVSDRAATPDEFRRDERETDADEDLTNKDDESLDSQ